MPGPYSEACQSPAGDEEVVDLELEQYVVPTARTV